VSALASPQVGDYVNRHFVATFQKVGTFRVAGRQKQGGNVASYFCTADGGVLGAVAGPADAATFLREARWVVETRKMALLESGGDPLRYRRFFRMAHAQRLADEDGVTDINWRALPLYTPLAAALESVLDRDPHAASLSAQGKVRLLLAAFPLVNLAQAYRPVYERVLGERVTTAPVVEGGAPAPRADGGGVRLRSLTVGPPVVLRRGGPDVGPVGSSAPSVEEARQQARAREVIRALSDPPLTEVCSGRALNVLLADLARQQADGAAAPSVPLPAEALAHLNLIAGHGRGNAGLLRDGGRLCWPPAWDEAPLREASRGPRAELDALLAEAVAQARKGRVEADVLEGLRRGLGDLHALLKDELTALDASQHVQAKRFLAEVADAVRLLESGDAARYLGGSLALDAARVRTVAGLVRFMADRGLVFAPAVGGDEAAYAAVREALASAEGGGAVASADAGAL
jgi:hypothetical protein